MSENHHSDSHSHEDYYESCLRSLASLLLKTTNHNNDGHDISRDVYKDYQIQNISLVPTTRHEELGLLKTSDSSNNLSDFWIIDGSHVGISNNKNNNNFALQLFLQFLKSQCHKNKIRNDNTHESSIIVLATILGDNHSYWNLMRNITKEKVHKNSIKISDIISDELHIAELSLCIHPKSSSIWNFRKWILSNFLFKTSIDNDSIQLVLNNEIRLINKINAVKKRNIHAWNHRLWIVTTCIRKIKNLKKDLFVQELEAIRLYMRTNISDHSCFHYTRQLLLHLFNKSEIENNHKMFMKNIFEQEVELNCKMLQQYPSRENIWIHRRFLFSFAQSISRYVYDNNEDVFIYLTEYLKDEINFVSIFMKDNDNKIDNDLAARYVVWIFLCFYNNNKGSSNTIGGEKSYEEAKEIIVSSMQNERFAFCRPRTSNGALNKVFDFLNESLIEETKENVMESEHKIDIL